MGPRMTETKAAATPAYTMYLDQSAHLDWDWLQTFEQNYWHYGAAPKQRGGG